MTFHLQNFQGSLSVLLQLIRKKEIALFDIPLIELAQQIIEEMDGETKTLDDQAQNVESLSSLILWKSYKLLPSEENNEEEEEEVDPKQLMEDIFEYLIFKETADVLSTYETSSQNRFYRGVQEIKPKNNDVSTPFIHDSQDLAKFFLRFLESGLIKKQFSFPSPKLNLEQAKRSILDKISQAPLSLNSYFATFENIADCIVSFLAILEIMKHQKAIIKQTNQQLVLHGTSILSSNS